MKRIAMISEHASPLGLLGGVDSGGQNVYVGQLAKHLTMLGYEEVDVFTRRDSDRLPEIVEWVNGIRIVNVPAGPPTYVRKEELLPHIGEFTDYMLQFCKYQRKAYDLLHANFWMSGLVAADIKKAIGIPFVITFHALGRVRRQHQGKADEFPDDRFAIEDRIVAEADRIIAECPQDEEDLIRLYNADPANISVVPCGFDPTELWPISKPLARFALGLSPDERMILHLGRIVPRKGIDTVIRGFARLVKHHRVNARLLIVGGEAEEPDPVATPEIGRLQAVAAEEEVSEAVQFIGRRGRDTLKYYYSAADVFVTTPWYEPFGITPVESMACGTPVVGSAVGGIKFTVRDGETGYVVPANNPILLADRIAHLYEHPKLLSVFSRQAIRRANDLFTWQKAAQSMAAVYEEVGTGTHPDRLRQHDQYAVIERGFEGVVEAFEESRRRLAPAILEAAEALSTCFTRGGKAMACGNGGSAADSQHFVAELVGRFKYKDRPGLPALALNADSSFLTAWSNDVGYDNVFARQVEVFGRSGDVLLGISTSGQSRNLIQAFEVARNQGLVCIALVGGTGGDLRQLAHIPIAVPSNSTQHIQEVQIFLLHLLCELVEERIHGGGKPPPALHSGGTSRRKRTRQRGQPRSGDTAVMEE